MNGGMKMISADGTRVLARNDPEIHALLLSELKTAEKVEIVSTGSAYSLIVRVSLRAGLFRDDLIGEDGQMMVGDERWWPTTGNPIRDVILKFILVSSPMTRYTYDKVDDKSTMLAIDVENEYKQQRIAFDVTKSTVPISPDVIELLHFPDLASFNETFPSNPIYNECHVFQELRKCMTTIPGATIAMIMMESIPATYVPLKQLFKKREIYFGLIAQICAMCVVLFHMCRMIALDAHRSNWLVDMMKPKPLRVKLIDYGMCLARLDTGKISEIVNTYFERHPTELPAYLKLMGAQDDSPSHSPSEVMTKAINSVNVPYAPMESWIHKILVISMLIDGFFNMNHSTKTTCQMKNVFNVVYDNACVSMSKMLQTLSLDLPTYLASQSQKRVQLMNEMLRNMALYMDTYYHLRPRRGMEVMDHVGTGTDQVALGRYGGKKMRKRNSSKRKRNKKKSSKSRKNKMHRK